MAKIDESIEILPDIEMYGGNNDTWVIRLYKPDKQRWTYSELQNKRCYFTLIIKENAYVHRNSDDSSFTLTKTGALQTDDDGSSATAVFMFNTSDTSSAFGKYIYQVEMICAGVKQVAQGTLFIRKNINQ